MKRSAVMAGLALLALIATGRPLHGQSWYSPAQADSGADSYYHRCGACHGLHLGGGRGPALVGDTFFSHFGGKKMNKLWLMVSTKMPKSAPGSLPRQDALNIIAYILRENSFPAGDYVSVDQLDVERVIPSQAPHRGEPSR
jgi:cytochrome c